MNEKQMLLAFRREFLAALGNATSGEQATADFKARRASI
jgi:hypothetical protein